MNTKHTVRKHTAKSTVPTTALSAMTLAMLSAHALAAAPLPTGENVQYGNASFDRTNTSLTIDQHTGKLIVNWDDFSVGAGNQVVFNQNSSDIALNRVVGDKPSYIFGDIRAGGQVFLVNQSGILFSPTARVDTAGLVASTLGLSDEDFLAGNYRFEGAGGRVVNQGRISVTDGGYVALLGQEAINEGIITARLGSVGLGAGDRMTLDFVGDGLINLQVDKATVAALVENRGLIVAPGGVVLMTASAMNELAATVVNNTGMIEATSLTERDGRVFLSATGGNIAHSGSINVSGEGAGDGGSVVIESDATTLVGGEIIAASGNIGGVGGDIAVLGAQVGLTAGAQIIASGVAGGGTVLVGGDFQGSNDEVRNAERTVVQAGARIEADALAEGDGGKVIVWADEVTRFYGSISATGGAEGGDGGFAEVSGKQALGFYGDVDLTAALGLKGTLLLDPQILSIINGVAGTGDLDGTLDPLGTIDFADTAGTDSVTVGQIVATSASADIVLNAGQINFDNSDDIVLAADASISFTADSATALGGNGIISSTSPFLFDIATSGLGEIAFTTADGGLIDLSLVSLNSAAGVTINSTSFVTLGNVSANTLDVTATADIQQAAGTELNIAGATTVTADNALIDVVFDQLTNDMDSLVLAALGGGAIDTANIIDSNAITVGGDANTLVVQSTGNITLDGGTYTDLTAGTGTGVDQNNTVTVSGATTINAVFNPITVDLSDSGNDFSSVGINNIAGGSASSVTISDANDLSFGGSATTADLTAVDALTLSGGTYTTLDITAGGGISQAAALTVNGTLTAESTAAGQQMLLTDIGNDLQTVALTGATEFLNVEVNNTDAFVFGGNAENVVLTGDDAINLDGGGYITLNVTAGADISNANAVSAGDLMLDAQTGIALTAIDALGITAVSAAGDISIANDQALSTTVNNLETTGGNITFTQTGVGAVTVSAASTTGAGTIDLTAQDGLTIDGAVTTAGGNISLDADSDGSNNGDFTLTGIGSISTAGGDLAITSNTFEFQAGSTVALGGGAATLTESRNALFCLGDAAAGFCGGTGVGLDNAEIAILVAGTNDLTLENGASDYIAEAADFQGINLTIRGRSVADDNPGVGLDNIDNLVFDLSGSIGAINGGLDITANNVEVIGTGGNTVALVSTGATGDTTFVIGSGVATGALTITQTTNNLIASAVDANGAVLDAVAGTLQITGDITSGGVVDLSGATGIELGGDVTTTNDNIAFNDIVTLTAAAQVDTGAGAGDILFTDTVDGAFALTLAAGTGALDLQADVGTGTALASFEVLSASLVDLPNVTADDIDVTGTDINLNGATYTANNGGVNLAGDVLLTGNTSLDSSAANGDLTVTGSTDGAFSLDLTAGTGNVDLQGNVGTGAALTALTVNSATTATFGADVTTTGTQDITAGTIETSGTHAVTTAGNIAFTGDLSLLADTTLDTSAANGDVTVTGTTDGAFALDLSAGTGSVDLQGNVGTVAALASLTVNSAAIATFGADVTTTGAQHITATDIETSGTHTVTTGGDILVGGDLTLLADTTFDTSASDDTITVTGTTDGAFALTLNAGATGYVEIVGDVGGTTPLTTFEVLAAGLVDLPNVTADVIDVTGTDIGLNGSNYTANNGGISFDGDVNVNTNTSLDSSAANGDITVTGLLDGVGALDLTAGTGHVDLQGNVGAGTALASLTVNSATTATFGADVTTTGTQDVTAGTIETNGTHAVTTAGNIAFTGDLSLLANTTLDTSAANGDITVTGSTDGAFDLTIDAGTGNIDLQGDAGTTTALANFTIVAATTADVADIEADDIAITAGQINLNGDTYTANDGSVFLDGSVALTVATTIDSSAADGDITFTDTLDGTFDLTLVAGAGAIDFGGLVGSTSDLGVVEITSAGDVGIDALFDAASFTQVAGGGTTTIDGALSATTGDIVINTTDIDQNSDIVAVAGNVSLTAAQGITLDAGVIFAGDHLIHLSAGTSAVQDAVNHVGLDATDLLLGGAGDFTLVINTNGNLISNLATDGTVGGTISFQNDQALTIGSVTDLAAVAHNGAIAGEVLVAVSSGDLTVDEATESTAGSLLLRSDLGAVTINQTVTASGSITVDAETLLTQAAAGDIDAGDALYMISQGDITQDDGATAVATNQIDVVADVVRIANFDGDQVRIRTTQIIDNGDTDVDVTAGELYLEALNDIGEADGTNNGLLDIDADTVAIRSITGSAFVANAGDLVIGTVALDPYDRVNLDGTTALAGGTTASGATADDNLVIVATGGITVDDAVDAANANLLLDAQGGILAINATVDAGGDASLLSDLDVTQAAAGDITVGGTLDVDAQGGDIIMTNGATATATGNARFLATGGIAVGGISAANAVLDAGGSITDNGDADADVTAATVQLIAGTDIGTNNGTTGLLDIDADTLALDAGGSVFVADSDDLAIGSVAAIDVERVGLDAVAATQAGSLLEGALAVDNLVVTAATSLTIDNAAEATNGNLLLQAQGGDLDINDTVLAGGSASLVSSANVFLDANVEATAGVLDIEAQNGNIEQADGTVATAGGNARLLASDDVLLASLLAANARIEATTGAIVDNGDTGVDVGAADVQLVAGTDIGEPMGTNSGLLDIDADTLALDAGGSAFVAESDDLAIGDVSGLAVDRVQLTGATSAVTGSPFALVGATAIDDMVVVVSGGNLTLDEAVEATNGNLLLTTGGTLDVNAAVDAGAHATLYAFNDITQDADVTAQDSLSVRANTGSITMADGTTGSAGTSAAYVAGGGDVRVSHITGTDVAVNASASIIDNGNTDLDIEGGNVLLVAGVNIGEAAGTNNGLLDIDADTLALHAVAGDAFVADSDGLTLGSITNIAIEMVDQDATTVTVNSGALAGALAASDLIVTAATDLTVDNAAEATAASLLLSALGGDLAINATVDAGTDASLVASANITQAAAGDVTTGGTLDVHAQGGDITMSDGALSDATGNVRYLATGSVTLGGIDGANVRVGAGTAIIDGGNTHVDITATAVQLVAGTSIGEPSGTNNGMIDTDVGTLAASAGTGGSIYVSEANALTIGSVAAIATNRVETDNTPAVQAGSVLTGAVAAQNTMIEAAGTMTVNNVVTATAADVLLHASAGDLAINALVTAGDDASLLASANVTQAAAGDISTGGTLDVHAQGGNITMTDGALSDAAGNVRYLATGDITLGGIDAANARIDAGGSIIDGGNAHTDVTAATIQLVAGTDIGEANGTNNGLLEIDATTLAADAGTNLFVADTSALTIGSVAAIDVDRIEIDGTPTLVAGSLLAGALAGNDLVITAATDLTVNNAAEATAGDLLLDAQGGDLDLGATVDAGQNGSLLASASVIQAAAGDITVGGTLDVEGGTGNIEMANGATATATGNARFLAGGDILVGGISAANAVLDAGGAILDNGDTDADVTAATVQLSAGTDIGEADGTNFGLLDIDADTLAFDAGGSAFVEDSDNLVIGSVAAIDVARVGLDGATTNQAGALLAGALAVDNLVVTAVTDLTVDSATEATNANLLLEAQGGDLDINAAVDAGGDASLLASANITQAAAGDITTGGTLDVHAQGGDITMTDGAFSDATGNARYLATGDILVAGISAANAVLDAGGSILDNGNTDLDVVAANAQFIAGTDIGASGDALDITVDLVAADADTGGVFLNETDFLEIGSVPAIDVERVALDATTATEAGALLEGIDAALDINVVADDMEINREVHSAGGDIFLQARAGGIDQSDALGAVIADAGDIEMIADDGSIYLQLVSALGNQVTLTASEQIVNNNGADTNVIADVLVASARDFIGTTAAGAFTDPTTDDRITTEVEESITVTLSEAGTVAIDNTSTDGEVDVIFNLPMADVDNGSSVWVRNEEALRAFGLEFATENNAVEFNGNLQLLAEHGDLWLNEDQAGDANPVDLVAEWMRLSAARGAFRNGDGSRFQTVGDGLSLTADDLVLITGGDLGVQATVDRLNVIGTGLYNVAPGGDPGDGGENANLDLELSKRDIVVVDSPILFETIVIDRQGEPQPDWIADLDAFFPYGWDENTFGLFTTGTVRAISLRQDDGGGTTTHDGSIRFVDNVQAGALSGPSDLTIEVRAGLFNVDEYAGSIFVDSGVSFDAENIGTPDTGSVSVYGNVLVEGSVIARDERAIELQGRGGDIIIDSDTSAAGRVLLSPGLGFDVIFTNAATFRVTQGITAEGDLVILSARNVVMDPGTAIIADGSVLIGADNITGDVVLADGIDVVEGDVILYNVTADFNNNSIGDIVVYTTGGRAGETYSFDFGNGLDTYTVTGSIVLGRQDVVADLEDALGLDPDFLDNPANVPPAALRGQNVTLIAADSIRSGWAIDYAGATLLPEQEPVHVVAVEDLTMDARGGTIGGTPVLTVGEIGLQATEQRLRVQVGDLMTIGAGEHDDYGVSANLVGNAERLAEIERVPGLITFNSWNVGGALDEKFTSGTSIDTLSYQLYSYGALGRNGPEALLAQLHPTHNAVLDVKYALGQPQPVPAVWVQGEASTAVNEFAEPAPETKPEEVVEPAPEEPIDAAVRRAHEVRSGDTLWEISKEYLGDPKRWPEIWKRTPEIKDPDLIFPGQAIELDAAELERMKKADGGKP